MTIALKPDTLVKLASAFGKDSPTYAAIVTAAGKSSYFAGELNAFFIDKKWTIEIGAAGKGVYTDPSQQVIRIASDWKESGDRFATTLAHELGHALLQNGFGGPTPNTPKEAINNNRVNEGVALTSEYIVAVQLGLTGGAAGNMHSDSSNLLTPQLSNIAKSLGINIGNLLYDSADALKLTSPASKTVEVAGIYYGSLPPSIAPNLTYDQYAADWWILGHCGVKPETVDWSKIKGPTISYSDTTLNGKPVCVINTEKIPFLPGYASSTANLQISGVLSSDGILTASLFGANGQITEQLKFSYSGFKLQDIRFGSNGKPIQQFDFKVDNSYTRYDFAADGSQTATLYGTAGQIVETAKFNASGFKLLDTFFGANGKATQQFEFKTDKSYTKYDFASDGSQTATLYGTTGQVVEIAKFNASGFKLVDTFFGTNGKATQQFEFKTDKSYTKYDFATDGSQTATLYGTTGKIVEIARFSASGLKTVDTFYGSNGKATQQFEFKTDKSYTKFDFATDGSQTATLYGTTGQIVETAKFNASGFKTTDTFYSANGKATQQFEFKVDKSFTKYDFTNDGAQTATLYGTTGKIVEFAKFNSSGFKTQDTFYGIDGKATKQYNFNIDKSYTLYNFAGDGSQTATLFGVNGQVTEYVKFSTSGSKIQDIYFGLNGKSTQQFDFNLDKSYTWHGFNADGSQSGAFFDSKGKITELVQFNPNGFKTQDIFYNPTGSKKQQFDFSLDNSYVSHKFDGSMEYVGMFGPNNIIFDYYQFSSGKMTLHDFFDKSGRVIEADRYGSNGKLSGFSKYQYNSDGSYWSNDYNASGNLMTKGLFGNGGQLLADASVYSNKLGGVGAGKLIAFGQI